MEYRTELTKQRHSLATAALAIARELEAGRAVAPFQEKLTHLASNPDLPVRAAIIASHAESMHALLSEIIGQDYNVCKVVVPSRLGFSEVLLQERGFLLDTGSGSKEFDDAGSFLSALQQAHALQPDDSSSSLEPLRVKLKAPAHLSGLCLLVPHSIEALVQKPALISTLADQADWVFLVGDSQSKFSSEQRQTIQLVLQQATGMQHVLVAPLIEGDLTAKPEEWWKGWQATLSLGLVRQGSPQLASRLAILTSPGSELRHYLVENRLLRQLDNTLALLAEETEQAQRMLGNRIDLTKDGLVGAVSGTELRKSSESIRNRLNEEADSLLKSCEREAKASFAPDGALNRQLRETVDRISTDDIEQTLTETQIRLTPGGHAAAGWIATVTTLARQRLVQDVHQLNEGLECSLRDAEKVLEQLTGARHKLTCDPLDDTVLWESICHAARPEVRYRAEMPRPTLGTRFNAARQVIMGMMMAGTILGGTVTLIGGDTGSVRTILASLMLPLLIVGFLWTYVSFRKVERLTLEKEVEKLQDGVLAELRRVLLDLHREQSSLVNATLQKSLRGVQQQIEAALDRMDKQRQRDADDLRRRQNEQQKSLELRVQRYRQFGTQLQGLQAKLSESRKLQTQWLSDWIKRFNEAKS